MQKNTKEVVFQSDHKNYISLLNEAKHKIANTRVKIAKTISRG